MLKQIVIYNKIRINIYSGFEIAVIQSHYKHNAYTNSNQYRENYFKLFCNYIVTKWQDFSHSQSNWRIAIALREYVIPQITVSDVHRQFLSKLHLKSINHYFSCSTGDRTIGWNFRFDDSHSCLLMKIKQIWTK